MCLQQSLTVYIEGRDNATSAAAASASASAAASAAAEGPGSISVSSGDSEVNGQQAVDHQPPPSASSPTRVDTAPVHGGETIPLGEAARNGHRSRQALVKSKANSTEGQVRCVCSIWGGGCEREARVDIQTRCQLGGLYRTAAFFGLVPPSIASVGSVLRQAFLLLREESKRARGGGGVPMPKHLTFHTRPPIYYSMLCFPQLVHTLIF